MITFGSAAVFRKIKPPLALSAKADQRQGRRGSGRLASARHPLVQEERHHEENLLPLQPFLGRTDPGLR